MSTMTLALGSASNDLVLNKHGQQYVHGPDEVGQRVKVTLNHFYGEYFLNLPGGVPWYEVILGGKNVPLAETLIRQAILSTPGVISILSFKMSFEQRQLKVEVVIYAGGATHGVVVYFPQDTLILDGGFFWQRRSPLVVSGGEF